VHPESDAELIGFQAGGDVRVTERIDIGIDAERDGRVARLRAGEGRDAIELAGRLLIDDADPRRDGEFELVAGFADAGKHDFVGSKPRPQRDLDFAGRIGIGAAAEVAQQTGDRERRIRLQRVVNACG